ncbi:hypothetical protein [Pantoea sp.]|uniref:hypothetical protein n=1 Tax=Pantoea sp. TaxID=69393 RepID=UPI0025E5A6EA|nr:hypothetical protein [Pantoea sp.]
MPDYRLFQKDHTLKAVNVVRQDQQDALTSEGYKKVWHEVHADNADAALLRYQQMRYEEENAAHSFATDSLISSLLSLISR